MSKNMNTEPDASKNSKSSEFGRYELETSYSRNTFLFGCGPCQFILFCGLVGFASWCVTSTSAPEETDRILNIVGEKGKSKRTHEYEPKVVTPAAAHKDPKLRQKNDELVQK